MVLEQEAKPSLCADCGAPFVCGAVAGLPTCWCMEIPTGWFEADAGASCYCPACLDKRISARRADQQASAPA